MAERISELAGLILSRLGSVLRKADALELKRLPEAIKKARRIFLCGQGRTGIVARAFAMRLGHLGLDAYFVGETLTPAITAGDLLIACSGSGTAQVTVTQVRLAGKAGARRLGITWDKNSQFAKACDEAVVLPVQQVEVNQQPRQFGGSLFEQALLIYFDAIAAALKEQLGVTDHQMRCRHSNLE